MGAFGCPLSGACAWREDDPGIQRRRHGDRYPNLAASVRSHSFIDKAYWEEKAEAMRTLYLPLSEIVVDEDRATGEVVAFMAFVEDYLAALFVAPAHQKRGVGSRLLALAKKMRGTLDLSVYAENERAVAFYQKNGFRITGERIEEVTGRTELLMAFP